MAPSLLAALGSLMLLAPTGALELSNAVHAYARHTQIGDHTAIDLDDMPRLAVALDWPTLALGVEYAPRLAWLDVLASNHPPMLVMHNARLSFAMQQPRYRLSLTQTAALGDNDFTQSGVVQPAAGAGSGAVAPTTTSTPPAAANPPAPSVAPNANTLNLLPGAEVVRVAAEETQLELHYLWSRRWYSDFDASLGFGGGADAQAQALLPRQRTARLGASLSYRASTRDDLTSGTRGEQVQTSNGFHHWIGSLTERWSRRLTTNLSSELGTGVALQDSVLSDGSSSQDVSAVASAALSYVQRERTWQARFDWNAGYAPQVNAVLGTLQNRVQTGARATLALTHTFVGLGVEATQTLPAGARDAVRSFSTSASLDQELVEWLYLDTGASLTWQRFNALATDSQSFWVLYAGVSARAPELRF